MASSLNGTGVTFSDSTSQASARVGPRAQVFTASGTFTVPAGITAVKVTVAGGGGGSSTTYGTVGGCGGVAVGHYTGLTPGGSVTVTVGAGGSGGASGTAGGTSSFGAFCSATGGAGGTSGATGVWGTGSGGTILNSVNTVPGIGSIYGGVTAELRHSVGPFDGYVNRPGLTNAGQGATAFATNLGVLPGAGARPGSNGCVLYVNGGVGGVVFVEW